MKHGYSTDPCLVGSIRSSGMQPAIDSMICLPSSWMACLYLARDNIETFYCVLTHGVPVPMHLSHVINVHKSLKA